ncbi:GAF and ANTAR domain-containing protein [Gandjariella thermophila]|uniref:Transcriptional regulator n=1 Tax=Gandjariella thermophila TaxID=1931992 RepID=A0A4D4J9S2_9PSEU|nr:GAF and ANTAR domain-containing protein [Gandjariella thermophila]GDY32032.1 transcriptional regulator [Gandjariella thermophila]
MTTRATREAVLAAAFVDIADTMVADFDVLDLLHRVARHCVNLLDASAAGMLLTDGHGSLRLLASSNEQARLVELFQLENDQHGPCVECFHRGEPVTAVGLSRWADRWPGFVREAAHQGFNTVHALPMRLRDQVIGGLNIFRVETAPLPADDLMLAQALADSATIAIVQQRAIARTEMLVEQLQGALNSRVIIEQAKGALSGTNHISVEEAFRRLRDYARAHNLLLTDVARAVVTDQSRAVEVLRFAGRPRS